MCFQDCGPITNIYTSFSIHKFVNIQSSVFELLSLQVQLYMAVARQIISLDIKGAMHDDETTHINVLNNCALFNSIKNIKKNQNQINIYHKHFPCVPHRLYMNCEQTVGTYKEWVLGCCHDLGYMLYIYTRLHCTNR